VPAQLIDSLSTSVHFEGSTTRPMIDTGDPSQQANIATGRRMVLFGPEGFREAPRNHRLVIVMGSSPEAFFKAVDSALGTVSTVQRMQANAEFNKQIFAALSQAQSEQERLADVSSNVAADLSTAGANP
jgi:hypothetical protein